MVYVNLVKLILILNSSAEELILSAMQQNFHDKIWFAQVIH